MGWYNDAVDVLDYDLEVWLPEPGGTRIEGRAKLTLAADRRRKPCSTSPVSLFAQ